MKRKATEQPSGQPRQLAVSCTNCRIKKLKCDRGQPCASCAVRGIPCTGQPSAAGATPNPSLGTNVSHRHHVDVAILSRLDNIEKALFSGTARQTTLPSTLVTAASTPSQSNQDTELQQTARFLDSTYTNDAHSIAKRAEQLHIHVAAASSHPSLSAGVEKRELIGSALLMTHAEALLFLRDFVENPFHMLPIIYEPSARSLIDTLYADLDEGRPGDPTAAALILSIASTSASFFAQNLKPNDVFSSTDEAAQASVAWRQTALILLEDTHSSPKTFAECQARTIIAYAVYNSEGCSARFRFLHSCSVAVARDMSLHLIDSSNNAGNNTADLPTKEIKRRLWWHLASTDWLLGLIGGPLDGTYSIQPRHCNVRLPRNLNDNDLAQCDDNLTYPLNFPTQMSCFLQRIRLSEIIRASIDARAPGPPDVEVTDFNTVTRLDRLFQTALSDLPPFLQIGAPIPPGAPMYLAQQRDLILLCFHIRRARLHRPFLIHDTKEPCYEPSRRQCIVLARTVLSIATGLLEDSAPDDEGRLFCHTSAYGAGLVISGIFLACTILALSTGLASNTAAPNNAPEQRANDTNDEIVAEVIAACRTLMKAGKQSTFAANLVHNLMNVLRQYRVKDVDDLVASTASADTAVENQTNNNDSGFQSGSGAEAPDLTDNLDLWNEFFTFMPEMEGCDQLFAGIDSFCGSTW
ncbi:hypothetical protein F4808DRAFT_247205 [Astrocystis sublimbata]|nr:hypothetical protein F4808DRAFT_247205 [Astrocystis sublimbata]